MRTDLIIKHGLKFRLENGDLAFDDSRATILSHYYIRGVDPLDFGPRGRKIEDGKVLFRRGGLDIKYAIDSREKLENI